MVTWYEFTFFPFGVSVNLNRTTAYYTSQLRAKQFRAHFVVSYTELACVAFIMILIMSIELLKTWKQKSFIFKGPHETTTAMARRTR